MQVTAVSDKTNTTGAARLGAFTEDTSQVALYDTPGVVHTRCQLPQTLQSALKLPLKQALGRNCTCTCSRFISMACTCGAPSGLVVPEAVTTSAGRCMGLAMHEVCAQLGGQPASVIC